MPLVCLQCVIMQCFSLVVFLLSASFPCGAAVWSVGHFVNHLFVLSRCEKRMCSFRGKTQQFAFDVTFLQKSEHRNAMRTRR